MVPGRFRKRIWDQHVGMYFPLGILPPPPIYLPVSQPSPVATRPPRSISPPQGPVGQRSAPSFLLGCVSAVLQEHLHHLDPAMTGSQPERCATLVIRFERGSSRKPQRCGFSSVPWSQDEVVIGLRSICDNTLLPVCWKRQQKPIQEAMVFLV